MGTPTPAPLLTEDVNTYDLPAIAALHAVCFEDAWHAELLGRILIAPGAFGLLTRPEGKTAGFIICRSTGQEGEIISLAVAPGVRRSGLGAILLNAAKIQATKRDIGSLFLEVAEDNLAARGLYEKSEFAIVGRRQRYYRRPYGPSVDALTLRCNLAQNSPKEN